IERRMPESGGQPLDVRGRKRVLLAFGSSVNIPKGKPRLVGEVALEQAMCPDHLQCEPLAIWRETEGLAARTDQALALHAADQRHDCRPRESKRTPKRWKRCPPIAVLLFK